MHIENPIHGQGYCAEHTANPYHDIFVSAGWHYSHTTKIHYATGGHYFMHTYKHPFQDWNGSVSITAGYPVTFSRGGSSREYTCFGSQVAKYLKRKNTELKRIG